MANAQTGSALMVVTTYTIISAQLDDALYSNNSSHMS
jgi:hypothetical protein